MNNEYYFDFDTYFCGAELLKSEESVKLVL